MRARILSKYLPIGGRTCYNREAKLLPAQKGTSASDTNEDRMKKLWMLLAILPLLSLSAPWTVSARADDGSPEPAPHAAVRVDDEEYGSLEEALPFWTEGTTLTLLEDCAGGQLETDETKTLDLNGRTLSLAEEQIGSVLLVKGTLTVRGGIVTGGNADRGGGIHVDVSGSLVLEDVTVTGNRAKEYGGGVYVLGSLTLRGETAVEDNTVGGSPNNIYLPKDKQIAAEDFTGRAGISPEDVSAPFRTGEGGEFSADDPLYIVSGDRLAIAPLREISAVYTPADKVFPSTSLETIKQCIEVTGINVNGADYPFPIEFRLSGELKVGLCVLTVTAQSVETQVEVNVVSPILSDIDVKFEQSEPVYFDTPFSELLPFLEVTAVYEDGGRKVLSVDRYDLTGDLNERTDGRATLTVHTSTLSKSFTVAVSKHVFDASDYRAYPVTIIEGANSLPDFRFEPALPEGVTAECLTADGAPVLPRELSAGTHEAVFSFRVADEKNYEMRGTVAGEIVVRRSSYTAEGPAECVFSATSGLPAEWRFTVTDVKSGLDAYFGEDVDVMQAYEITLYRGESEVEPGEIRVRVRLTEEAKEREVRLYRVEKNGVAVAVDAERDGDYLVFMADDLLEARYVVGSENDSTLYTVLSVVFGALCLAGAGVLFWYLVFKRKLMKK